MLPQWVKEGLKRDVVAWIRHGQVSDEQLFTLFGSLLAVKLEKIVYASADESRGVRGRDISENQVASDGSPKDVFYRKQLLFSFKKLNKQSAYGVGIAGIKAKYENGHTTVNVWI